MIRYSILSITTMPDSIFWNAATRWVARELNCLTSHVPPPPRSPDDDDDDGDDYGEEGDGGGPPSPRRRRRHRRILLVHAHPVSDSYSAALANAVVLGASEGGHEVRRRSLYAENFRPELTSAERECYFDAADDDVVDDDDSGEGGGGASLRRRRRLRRLSPDVSSHLADLRWADSLVLVYPTWWFDMPAMLKGYFDRTFVRGETWDFPGREKNGGGGGGGGDAPAAAAAAASSSGLVPKLTNIRRVMGVSTYGATRSVTFLAGDNGRNCVSTAIRHGNFAPGCTCLWLGLYGMDDSTEKGRGEFLDEVRKSVREEF